MMHCTTTILIVTSMVTLYVALCSARPSSEAHHVKPRKYAESSQAYSHKDYTHKSPITDAYSRTQAGKKNQHKKSAALHKVKLSLDTNVPFDKKNLEAKYNANLHPVTNGRSLALTKKSVVTDKSKKESPAEVSWPKLDDTDRLPDHITKPVRPREYHWKNRERCIEDYECAPGRMCVGSWCECMTEQMCYHHHQPICGSDGMLYPSHCELHRTACVERRHIRIDHSASCVHKLPVSPKVGLSKVTKHNNAAKKKSMNPGASVEKNKSPNKKEKNKDFLVYKKDYKDNFGIKKADKPDDVVPSDLPPKPPVVPGDDTEHDYGGDDNLKLKEKEIHKADSKKLNTGAQKDVQKPKDNTAEKIPKKVESTPKDSKSEIKGVDSKHGYKDMAKTKVHQKSAMKQERNPVTSKKDLQMKGKELPHKFSSDNTAKEAKKTKSGNMDFKHHCSKEDYEKFKEELIRFHCEKFGEPDCDAEVINDRAYLAKLMFRFYDNDMDGVLKIADLKHVPKDPLKSAKQTGCTLADMVTYEDLPSHDIINLGDFYNIFSLKKAQLFDKNKVLSVVATVGHGLELTCGIHGGGGDIIWQRHGQDVKSLHLSDITSFSDGSLYISRVEVHHSGNFTCFERSDPALVQTHLIIIQMVPRVHVVPSTQLHKAHSDVWVQCHVEGIPYPRISWQINEVPLPTDHYIRMHHNDTLVIQDADYERDTGAYKCLAENEAGTTQRITTVFIEKINSTIAGLSETRTHGLFVVFHNTGYTVYDPLTCSTYHFVTADFDNFKYPSLDKMPLILCSNKLCIWGKAVTVKGKYIYVTQPQLNRIIVMETRDHWNPIQAIETDKAPVAVHYLEHLDQVWILCWNGDKDSGSKTVVVVRDASKDERHRVIHTQPIGNKFDLVKNLYLAPSNDFGQVFHHGYVTHSRQRGMYKLDTEEMKYIKSVDLSQYECLPLHIAFVPLGGKVMVACEADGILDIKYFILELDYLSDRVITTLDVRGKPYVAPDSRTMIVVDGDTGDTNVYSISDQGKVTFSFVVKTAAVISDVAFQQAADRHGYNAFLNSHMKDEVYFINLNSGTVDTLKGESVWLSDTWVYDSPFHAIAGSGVFGRYLVKTSDAGITVINGASRDIQCDFREQEKSHEVIWVEP